MNDRVKKVETEQISLVNSQYRAPYVRPEVEIIEIEMEGVIAASDGATGNGQDIPWVTSVVDLDQTGSTII